MTKADAKKAVLVLSTDSARTASLVIELAKSAEVWELDLTRTGTEALAVEKAAESFNVDGDRCSLSLRQGVAARLIDAGSIETLKSTALVAAAMHVEPGLQQRASSAEVREYFVKGARMTGTILIETVGALSRVAFSDDSLPRALTVKGISPEELACPNGGLPSALAAVVRKEHRYWEKEGVEITKAHDALIASQFFTTDNVRIVNGAQHRVVHKTYLYVPSETQPEKPRPKFRKRIDTILGDDADIAIIAAPVAGECWEDVLSECLEGVDKSVVAVIAESRPAVDPDELADVISKLDRPFAVGLRNTDHARNVLSKLSSPFVINGDDDFVWACSGAVAKAKNVSFLAKGPIPQFFEDYKDHSGEGATVPTGHTLRVSALTRQADPDGGWFYGCGVEVLEEAVNAQLWKDAIRLGEKWFTPMGTTMRTDTEVEQGATLEVLAHDVIYKEDVPKLLEWTTKAEVTGTGGKVMKAAEVIKMLNEVPDMTLTEKVLSGQKIIKTIMPVQGAIEERFVLGIVLEPEEVDAQQDIYSEEEVRSAAHKFMEQYQNIGLMHRDVVNEQVKILESYVSPVEFEMDGIVVRKGTWLLAVRVLDDQLWVEVKEGGLTGFSIGGSAVRVPDRPALN